MANPPADGSFSELFQTHAAALMLYARQWVDAAGAEDVVQEVFVRFLGQSLAPAEPRTWLFRCVRNEAISAARSHGRRSRRERNVAEARREWFASAVEDRVDGQLARQAMERLPAVQREVLVLRLWSGLTLAGIGAITGLATSSVHDQYRQGLARIRQEMETICPKTSH